MRAVKRILLVLAPVVIVGLTVSYYLGHGKGGAFINLAVTPSGSIVKLDGKGVRAGKIKVSTGNHSVSVSHNGFAGKSKDFSVELNETRFIGIVLVSDSPETTDWYITHPEDQRMAESIASRNFDQGAIDLKKRYPILSELPFIDQLYRVDYGSPQKDANDNNPIALYVTYYSKEGKKQAQQWLKFKGVNLSMVQVIYINKST